MNLRSTALLFGLLLGMLWIFGLMVSARRGPTEESFILPTLHDPLSVTIVSVKFHRQEKDKEPQDFEFTRPDKNTWVVKQPPLFPTVHVEAFKVDQFIRQAREARQDESADVVNDPPYYNLDKPTVTVTLHGYIGKDEENLHEWRLAIGKEHAGHLYVMTSDRPGKVMAVARSALDNMLFSDTASLRPKTLLEVNEQTVREIVLKKSNPEQGEFGEIILKKNEDRSWKFVKPAFGLADFEGKPEPTSPLAVKPPKQEGGIKGLIGKIGDIRVAADADFVALSDAPMSNYGLEEGKEYFRIQVTTPGLGDETKTETLLVGHKGDRYYARLLNDQGVVKLQEKALRPILVVFRDAGKLRSRDLLPMDIKSVDAVDLRQGKDLKEEMKLRHPEGRGWQIFAAKDTRSGDEKSIQALIDALQGKGIIKDFVDVSDADAKKKDAELGFTAGLAEVKLWSNGLETAKDKEKDKDKAKTEAKKDDAAKNKSAEPKFKKDAKPLATLVFGKIEKDVVYVKRTSSDGTVSRLAVDKALLDKVRPPEGVLAFLDTALPAFDHAKVMRIEIDRNGEKTVVDHAGSQWLLVGRKDYAGKNLADDKQTNQVLTTLSSLHAQKWIKKVAPKEDLAKFGLQKPVLTATVVMQAEKYSPASVAGFVGQVAPLTAAWAWNGAGTLAASRSTEKGESFVYTFGKYVKDKGAAEEFYARYSGNDLLFQVAPAAYQGLRDADLRDRTWLTLLQPVLDAGMLGMFAEPNQIGALLAGSPLVTGQIMSFDSAKVSLVDLTVRTRYELRHLHFQRDAKGKTWQDKSGLAEFQLDSERVNELLGWLGTLTAERLIFLEGGPREEQKLLPKDALLIAAVTLDDGRKAQLTVGAREGQGYYAVADTWPEVVFQLPAAKIEPLLDGPAHFGKARVAQR
jgi:uncharacterized protein DUF4340